MITKISGIVDVIEERAVVLEVAGLYYSIMMTPASIADLHKTHKQGDTLLLFTHYYIEGSIGIGNLVPRLTGFFSEEERGFFEVFTTVKGLGAKKALQSITRPVAEIASAIENGDNGFLKTLPGFGGRMAEKIIAELKGKVTEYASQKSFFETSQPKTGNEGIERAALEVLIEQLGYRRVEAEQLIGQALAENSEIRDVEALIKAIFEKSQAAGR